MRCHVPTMHRSPIREMKLFAAALVLAATANAFAPDAELRSFGRVLRRTAPPLLSRGRADARLPRDPYSLLPVLRATVPDAAEALKIPPPSTSSPVTSPSPGQSRLRILKDKMWLRETIEDLTAAEFAARLESPAGSAPGSGPAVPRTRGGRAVDFQSILSKLDGRIDELCPASLMGAYADADAWKTEDTRSVLREGYHAVVGGQGAGSVVCTDGQREELLAKIQKVRSDVLRAVAQVSEMHFSDDVPLQEGGPKDIDLSGVAEKSEKEGEGEKKEGDEESPTIYVRDDGTIDWDGALNGAEALKTFGTTVWARINGRQGDDVDETNVGDKPSGEAEKAVTAKVQETETIREMKTDLEKLERDLKESEKRHSELLNSAVVPGTAVANVKFAALDPELRLRIQDSDAALQKKKDMLSYRKLKYDLERIFVYLEGEMSAASSKGYVPLQDRLAVAEFGLLEGQVGTIRPLFEANEGSTPEDVDVDVLQVIMEQTADLKRRLGIDFLVTGFTYDPEAFRRWLAGSLEKFKVLAAFGGKGCQLFYNDLKFSTNLVSRAISGYTLKPREVRTLRRTFKDLLSFIPFVIILILPLSPVGHVLIFGAIQRVFPEFFPSPFTEARQNLFQLYESTEFTQVTFQEGFPEKFQRVFEAIIYIIVTFGKTVGTKIGLIDEIEGNGSDS
eukprot:CAMPEP_0194269052 /NCGR_PEP_ID=MMETSP0169-20130528/3277_1 /TAXON_ID=218684 /ORGANISM="Corethron pennatum, Strain L29A3" /LENGTH=676 /DNA_ID=CAMNT_0039010557 /DNA_START=93 /DNA_END=2123 /DNA_ORIENTATION=-